MAYKNDFSGVYMILNKTNGKFYIGSSRGVKNRLSAHKYALKANIHHNDFLQRAYNKYGENNFIFQEVEKTNLDNYLEREQYWINFHECYKKDIGYNINKFATNTLGYKHKKEDIQKFSKTKKENIAKLSNEKRKEIYGKGRKDKKISNEHLNSLKKGLLESGWLSSERKKEIVKKSNFEKISKPVLQYDIQGNFIAEFHNARLAGESLRLSGIKYRFINNVARINKSGKSDLTAYGYIWKYKNN